MYCTRYRIINIIMLLMTAIQTVSLASSTEYNVDQCDYGTGEDFTVKKLNPRVADCIKFKDGI